MHQFAAVILFLFIKVISLFKYGPIHCEIGLPNYVLV